MGNTQFGKFVKILRSQKTEVDDDGITHPWTQEKLAEAASLSVRQLARIEQGNVEDLKPHLQPLAQALGLSATETSDFYAKAGFIYAPKRMAPSRDLLKTWLAQLHHPASARTPLWDFVAFNEYHRVVRGYTPETLQSLDQGSIGPNLLRVLFSSDFGAQAKRHLHAPNWEEKTIWAFRAVSFRYADTKRYALIRREMENYPEFDKAWQRSSDLPAGQDPSTYRSQITKLNYPDLGKMEFMSLRIPEIFTGPELIISVYVPLATTEAKYQQLRNTIKGNQVYFFRNEPLE